MKNCPGTSAIHDLQLSQLPRDAFVEISGQIPVFYYDWSGRSPIIKKRTVKQDFTVCNDGLAGVVFMWWELNMDTEGTICISCAPWWCHPDAKTDAPRPQDTIPWRDHWMQGVYYFPQDVEVHKGEPATLISCQDEYSLWFYLDHEENRVTTHKKPFCECGVHMAYPRTHVAYLNDSVRSTRFIEHLRAELNDRSVVLDINGSSLMGMAAAVVGESKAKAIYILASTDFEYRILTEYSINNDINNVVFITEITDEILREVTHLIGDPNFAKSIMPWDNLKVAYLMYQHRDQMVKCVSVTPWSFELWAMPVEFKDLHKIKLPIRTCEGIDMSEFDKLLEESSSISDAELEPQPLWEYPCTCRGEPVRLLSIHFAHLRRTYAKEGVVEVVKQECRKGEIQLVNGLVLWAMWDIVGLQSTGPILIPIRGQRVEWDPQSRQACKIYKTSYDASKNFKWKYQVDCDLQKGTFNASVDLVVH